MTDHIRDTAQEVFNSNATMNQYSVANVPFHVHNGMDSNRVNQSDLTNKSLIVTYTLEGLLAQTASNYSIFFMAPFSMTVSLIQEVHTTANGGALTLGVEKLTGTTAPGSGVNITATTFNLNATANTPQTVRLSTVIGSVQMAQGDRLSLVKTGTPISIANILLTLIINY